MRVIFQSEHWTRFIAPYRFLLQSLLSQHTWLINWHVALKRLTKPSLVWGLGTNVCVRVEIGCNHNCAECFLKTLLSIEPKWNEAVVVGGVEIVKWNVDRWLMWGVILIVTDWTRQSTKGKRRAKIEIGQVSKDFEQVSLIWLLVLNAVFKLAWLT